MQFPAQQHENKLLNKTAKEPKKNMYLFSTTQQDNNS